MKLFSPNETMNRQINLIDAMLSQGYQLSSIANKLNSLNEPIVGRESEMWNEDLVKRIVDGYRLGSSNALLIQRVITRHYKASNYEKALEQMNADAMELSKSNYFPTSRNWEEGTYGCGGFLVAFLLAITIIGIVVFIFMLFVKPAGTLTVQYELKLSESSFESQKICPRCAEGVKVAAKVCRFCNHEF